MTGRMNNKGKILGIAVFSLILIGLAWLLITQSIIPIAQDLKSISITGNIISDKLSAPEQKAAAAINNEIKTSTKTIEMNGNSVPVSVSSYGSSSSNIQYKDDKLTIERQGKKIEFSGIENNNEVNVGFDDDIESNKFVNVYAIDPSKVIFEKATVTVIAQGSELWKCKDWNFTEKKCLGSWQKIMDIVPGQDYTFELTLEDPGFGEINATAAYHFDENYGFVSDIFAQIEHKDNVWSEPIPENHIVRVSYQKNMTNGNVIDVYYRSNNSGYFEVYYPNTTNPGLGVSNNATAEGSWVYITLSNMTALSDNFDFKIFGSPIEFDYIHDDDIIPPSIALVSPEDNYTEINSLNISFTYNVSDDSNITWCTLYIRDPEGYNTYYSNQTEITKNTNQTISAAFHYNGNYVWSVECIDSSENIGLSRERNITLAVPGIQSIITNYTYYLHNESDSQYTSYRQMKNVSTDLNSVMSGAITISSTSAPCWNVSWIASNWTTPTYVNGTWDFTIYTNCSGTAFTTYYIKTKILKVNSTGLFNPQNTSWAGAFSCNGTKYPRTWNFNVSSLLLRPGERVGVQFCANRTGATTRTTSMHWENVTSSSLRFMAVQTSPPAISIAYPANTTYNTNVSALNYTVSGASACWYSLNLGVTNITIANCANVTGLTSTEGSNAWKVYANDSVGNLNSSSVTFFKDTIAPGITIVHPVNNSDYNNITLLVNISATGAANVWFYNGTANESYNSPVYRKFQNGSNTIYAYANDSAGNFNQTSSTFYIDITKPLVEIISPINRTYNNRTVLVEIIATNIAETTIDKVWYNWNGTNITYTAPINVTFSEVSNTLYAYANDTVGNLGNRSVIFSIDSIIPLVNVSYPQNITHLTNVSELNYTASDLNLQACWYSLDSGITNTTIANCTNVTGLASVEGSNTWRVYANDSVGNQNSSSVTFVRDIIPPIITIYSPLNQTYTTKQILVNFTADSYQALWFNNETANVSYSSPIYINVSEGSHTFIFNANESSGNFNQTSITFFVDSIKPSINITYPANTAYDINVSELNYTVSDINLQSCWYSLDSGITNITISNCANLTGLISTEGSNTWKVYANDSAGNQNYSSVMFIKDTLNPLVSIDYPANQTYNTNVSALNYTASDANLQTCWYSLNSGITNTTISNCTNVTGLTSTEGSNTWKIYANDPLGNSNSSSVTFFKDSIIPLIQFVSPTTETGNYSQNSIAANITASDTNLQAVTIYLYNSSGLTNSTASTSGLFADFTGLSDGAYYLNATATDVAGNANSTETRTIILDTTLPVPQFVSPTETTGSYINRTEIKVNISVTETNFKNTTIRLYNSTSLINTTTSISQIRFVNFTASTDGLYYFNATSCDIVNQCNSTETRSVIIDTIIPTFSTNQTRPSNGSLIMQNSPATLKANATDNIAVSTVSANVTWSSGSQIVSLAYNTGTGLYEGTFTNTTNTELYNVTFTATDFAGNSNTTATYFTVYETNPPVITYTNISKYAAIVNETVTIDMNATDANLDRKFINITLLNGTALTYYTLPVNFNSSLIGRYNVTFIANDTAGNIATQDDYFIIGYNQTVQFNIINSNLTGIDNILIIYLADTNKTVHTHEFTGAYLDEHAQTIYDLLFKTYNNSITVKLRNINLTLDYNSTLGIDKVTVSGYLVTYGINNTYTIANATLTLNYSSLSYHEDYLSVYRCANWSFENRICNSDWQLISANQDKTSHLFDVDVSGFSGYSIKDSYTAPSPSAPSGGVDGGGGFYKACTENWTCSEWDCIDGTAKRTCTDSNQCRTIKYKPAEITECAKVSGCFNKKQDGLETDIDCGGNCGKCLASQKCAVNNDCLTGVCSQGICITREELAGLIEKEKPIAIPVICWWIWAFLLLIVLALLLLLNLIDSIIKPSFHEKIHEYIKAKKEFGILRPELRKVRAEEIRIKHSIVKPAEEVKSFSENLIRLIKRRAALEPEIKAIKEEISKVRHEAKYDLKKLGEGISAAKHELIINPEHRISRFIEREEDALKQDARKVRLGISNEAESIRQGFRQGISSARHEAIVKPEGRIKRFSEREMRDMKDELHELKQRAIIEPETKIKELSKGIVRQIKGIFIKPKTFGEELGEELAKEEKIKKEEKQKIISDISKKEVEKSYPKIVVTISEEPTKMIDLKTGTNLPRIRTRAERLEEEKNKQKEIAVRQQEIDVEKARRIKRYVISRAAEQENSKTEAAIRLGSHKIEKQKNEKIEDAASKNSENILTALNSLKIKPGKKKLIKHYMIDKLKDIYN